MCTPGSLRIHVSWRLAYWRVRVFIASRSPASSSSRTARQALGFEELLAGDLEAMKARTRRYAKRQLTWMRKLPGVQTIDTTGREAEDVAGELHAIIRRA